MHIVKRMIALCIALLVLMMTTACAEPSFLVHSNEWSWEGFPAEVLLKADVDTHMPFDDDRLAMLTPILDKLSLRLITGEDEGCISICMDEEEALTLQYQGNEAQLSSMPDLTYQAQNDPLNALLGVETVKGFSSLGLSEQGETLLTDGRVLLEKIPAAFEQFGKRSANTTNISGFGQAAYRYDYTVSATQVDVVKDTLLSICPEGWLREIISGLSFSGKQTLRIYYTAEDRLLRAEFNGVCGSEDDLRTVKLVYKYQHDDTAGKDYVELTSPAKKGKNKNTLTFERTLETNKKGQRTLVGSFNYTVTVDNVTSIRKGEFNLHNAFTDDADVIGGQVTLQNKLNGAEKYSEISFAPDLTISGTAESPSLRGTLTVAEKYAGKTTEQAVVAIELKRAEPLEWVESFYTVDLSVLNEEEMAALQQQALASITTAIVRQLINQMGTDAAWFFRELPEDAVQTIIEAAGSAE